MSYLTGAGLNMPRQADFIREIQREYQAQTGQTLDLEYDSALGALVSVVTLQLDQVAEAVQGVYDSSDENNATGGQLESLAAITGIIPFNATPSKVDLTCRGTPGTQVGPRPSYYHSYVWHYLRSHGYVSSSRAYRRGCGSHRQDCHPDTRMGGRIQ